MSRIVYSILLAMFFGSGGFAQTSLMNVKLKDGTVHSFDIGDITKITFGSLTGVVDPQHLGPLITSFALFQNYPNPFNPTTTIRYTIPRGGVVHVVIFDVSGRRVREYVREYSQAGTYAVEWNGSSDDGRAVASGLYFYQTKFEQAIVSRKMLFLK